MSEVHKAPIIKTNWRSGISGLCISIVGMRISILFSEYGSWQVALSGSNFFNYPVCPFLTKPGYYDDLKAVKVNSYRVVTDLIVMSYATPYFVQGLFPHGR